MRVFFGVILLIVTICSLGEAIHRKVFPGGIMDRDVNDPEIFNGLADKLNTMAPKGLTNEKGMKLVKLKKAQSQVVKGVRWIYEFEAQGLSSNNLYSCKLDLLKQIWISSTDYVNYFNCNKS